ncbi:MAG: hypothetical protein QXI37_03885 [Thermoprotei archaeon]
MVTVSDVVDLEPWEASEFYVWLLKNTGWQPIFRTFKVGATSGNRFGFDAEMNLLFNDIKVSGTGIYSPEREIVLEMEKIGARFVDADPAEVRFTFCERSKKSVVAKTWHFNLLSRWKRTYEWALALQVKYRLRNSFKMDSRSTQAWRTENKALREAVSA